MNRELYPLLQSILDLDDAERLDLVGVILDSLAESDTVDREWLEDARRRYDEIREKLAAAGGARPGTRPELDT